MTSPKRRKREGLLSRPLEIASTPERSHRRPEPDLQSEEDKVIIVPHDEELEANPLDDDGEPEEDGTIVGRQPSPTLSSPSRRTPFTQPSQRHGTQAVFRDPTQYIDFDVPEPDEGWDDELDRESPSRNLDPNSQLIDSPPSVTVPETQPAVEDTQNILDSRTQMLDLSVAEPDGGWDSLDLVPSSPIAPSHHSSPMPVQRSHTPPPRPRRQSPPKPAPTPVKTYQTALKDWYADVSEDHKSTDISTALRATCCDMVGDSGASFAIWRACPKTRSRPHVFTLAVCPILNNADSKFSHRSLHDWCSTIWLGKGPGKYQATSRGYGLKTMTRMSKVQT